MIMDSEQSLNEDTTKHVRNSETMNVDKFIKSGFKTLIESIKQCSGLPIEDDFDFCSTDESFKNEIHGEGLRILTLMNNIQKYYGMEDSFKNSFLEHKTELLIETNDWIMEKVADNIDEMNGIKKFTSESVVVSANTSFNGSWNWRNRTNSSLDKSDRMSSSSSKDVLSSKNIVKPQKFFTDTIDNSNSNVWTPRIKDKPNSIKPLALFLEHTDRGEEFSHPYEVELQKFQPSDEQLSNKISMPDLPKKLEETKLVEINSPDQLRNLINDLHGFNIIAIDLEHHSYRSFMGFTCLMQISTVETDYLVDTIALRNDLHCLNEIFTKPSILKVLHGADSDILWLQRDLSLYIVNMFDTHQASKILEYKSLSLAFLVEKFCRIKLNKQYQLADWRIRPLPDYLKNYAREDTHYLIYIYQMIKNELLTKSGGRSKLLEIVYQRSKNICQQIYWKPKWTEESHLNVYRGCKRMFDNRQMYAFRKLFEWRDSVAREEDESIGYVLPNHMLVQISEILPREMQGILACCNPVPPLVKSRLLEIHQIISRAREKPLETPILAEDARARGSTLQFQEYKLNHPLYCPHDLSYIGDFRDDLPTLLNQKDSYNVTEKNLIGEKSTPVFTLLHKTNEQCNEVLSYRRKRLLPFERYQFVKPFILHKQEKQISSNKIETNSSTEVSSANTKNESPQPSNADIKKDILLKYEDDIEKINENLENLTKDDSTEERRIESVQNHFMLLSKKTAEDRELAERKQQQLYEKINATGKSECLSETVGANKRKRTLSESEVKTHHITKNKFLHPAPYHMTKDVPLSKLPNKNSNQQGTSQKGVRQKKRMTKKCMGMGMGNMKKIYGKNIQIEETDVKTENRTENNTETSTPSSSGTISHNTERRQQSRKKNNEDSFQAFDYSSVDFRQFQGGAAELRNNKRVTSCFKTKGKKQKIFNKSCMSNLSRKRR